jgi:hypothetical protein
MQIPAKELAIIVYLALGYGAVGERIASLGVSASLGFYMGLFSILSVSIVAAAYVRNRYLRSIYALLLAGSALFLDTTERVLGDHLTYDQFVTLLNSFGAAGEAADQYRAALLSALPAALLLLAGVSLKPRRMFSINSRLLGAGPVLGIGVLALVLFVRGGEGARGLPSAIPPLAYSSVYLYESATGAAGPRQAVTMSPRKREEVRDVVLVIDESVTANYLDINTPRASAPG